jgi:hypothetical protein
MSKIKIENHVIKLPFQLGARGEVLLAMGGSQNKLAMGRAVKETVKGFWSFDQNPFSDPCSFSQQSRGWLMTDCVIARINVEGETAY